MQQVDDQLEFVHHLVIGDFRLVTGLDQGLEARNDQLGRAPAQHRLLAEQVGLGLLGERGLDDTRASAADAGRIGEGDPERVPPGILVHGDQTRYTMPFLVLAPHQPARALRCDQRDVQIVARLDLLEMDGEAMREQQRRTCIDVVDNGVVQRFLNHVRRQEHHDLGARDGVVRLLDRQAIRAGLVPACAIFSQAHNDVETAVPEIQGMCAPLAAVTEYGDLAVGQTGGINV